MRDPTRHGVRPIGLQRRNWLAEQLRLWHDQQIISADQQRAILALYGSEDDQARRHRHRAFLTLVALAVVMLAAGVLMLIGYNWDQITRPVKVTLIIGAVAAAYTASAALFHTGRHVAGEMLALLGALLTGCAIWLLAQVYHIESHYPDGLLWWMIAALITAWAVGSRFITILTVLLLGAWALSEAGDFERFSWSFVAFALIVGALASRQGSTAGVLLTAAAAAVWLLVTSIGAWNVEEPTAPLMLLLGTAYYATGTLPGRSALRSRGWQVLGLLIVLIAVIPMTFHDFFEYSGSWWQSERADVASMTIAAGVLTFWAVGAMLRSGFRVVRHDWPILIATFGGIVALVAQWAAFEIQGPRTALAWTMAICFSALVIVLAVWLIQRGLRLDRGLSFFAGVVYMLIFVLVRWVDLIGDMISSAILFFIAGAALLGAALYWRSRGERHPKRNAEVDHA